ncbi:MAG: hypothetical protein IKN38_07790 [Clostridia bacterium]|nr:hypothetical protein [Clostridia bacterium]
MRSENRWAWYIGTVAFYLILILFDGFTTYLVTPDLKWEANPTVSFFGGGWTSLIVVGVIMAALFAVFAYFPMICYKREAVECCKLSEFFSKVFGKCQKKKKIYRIVPVGVIVIAAGIISRIYVITSALLSLNGHEPCLFCALGIKHKICNCITFELGDRRVIISVVMYAIVGALSVASFLIWLKREYKKSRI